MNVCLYVRLPHAEKKKLIATAIITAVEAVMSNHIYSFNNIWRRQRDGGAIGNALTGEVAKVVMAWWMTRFNLCNLAAPQPIPMEDSDSQYVDDYNFLYYILEPGTRWIDEDETMKVVENLVDQDKEVPEDVRSMDEIVKMANSICPIL